MSKVRVNSIEDLNGQNQVTIQSIKETTDKQTIFDWYERGECFTTFKELDESFAYKITEPFSVNEFNDFALFNIYQAEGKKFEVFNNGIYKSGSEIRDSFKTNIPLTDEIDCILGDSISLRRNDEVFYNEGAFADTSVNNNYTYHVYTHPNKDYVLLLFKVGFNLHILARDLINETNTTTTVNSFFNSATSKIKQTPFGLYELDGTSVYRFPSISYNAESINAQITNTLILDQADLITAGYNGTFSGETTRPDYGWGEDIQVITFIKELTDYFVIADKQLSLTNFLSLAVTQLDEKMDVTYLNSNLSNFSYQNLFIENLSSGFYQSGEIQNDNANNIRKSKNFIYQDSNYSIMIGSFLQFEEPPAMSITLESNFNDGLETHTTDVYNNYNIQRIEISENVTPDGITIGNAETELKWFKILKFNNLFVDTQYNIDNIALLPLSFGNNSITFNIYTLDQASDPQTGTVQYNTINKIITVNYQNMEEIGTGNYKDFKDEVILSEVLDPDNIETVYIFDFYNFQNNALTETYNFSNFYHAMLNSADTPRPNDNYFVRVVNYFDGAGDIRYFKLETLQGFIFKPLSDQVNINTYIKK